jgi:hypothetical protein
MGVISSLRGGTNRDALSPPLREVLDMAESAPGVFDVRVPYLLLEWGIHVLTPQVDSLLRGDVTPESFAQTLEEGVQRARHKPGLVIPPPAVYEPHRYGEAA